MQLLSRIVPAKFEGRHVVLVLRLVPVNIFCFSKRPCYLLQVDELLDHGATMENMKKHLLEKLKLKDSDVTKCVLFAKVN